MVAKKPGGSDPPSRAADGKAPKQPGNFFTKIGENDEDLPPPRPVTPPRPRFPDESIPAMQPVSETPTWKNESEQRIEFDNLPSEDWELDNADIEEAPAKGLDQSIDSVMPSPAIPDPQPSTGFAQVMEEPSGPMTPEAAYEPFKQAEYSPFSQNEETATGETDSNNESYAQPEESEAARFTPSFSAEEPERPSTRLIEHNDREPERVVPDSKQFREACLASSTADSAMGNENYKVALPLFKKSYKLFKKAAATDSQEFGNCLHKLADCFYHEEEFQEALEHYEEFVGWAASRNDRPDALTIVVNLKRARTFQKLDRLSECEQAFDTTVKMANQFLPVSHPLFAVVYNSYIAMLQLAGTPQERIKQIEEQFAERMMTSSRTVAIPQDLQAELSAWTEVEQADLDRLERNRQLRLSRQMFQKETSKSGQLVHSITHSGIWRTLAIVAVTLMAVGVLSLAVIGFVAFTDQGDKKASKNVDPALAAIVGTTYTSADGLKSVVVDEAGNATLKFGNDSIKLAAKPGLPKEGFGEDIRKMIFGKTAYVLEQVKDGLKDPDGTILYEPANQNLRIPKEMDQIAELANFYFSRHQNKYPKKRKAIAEMGPDVRWENPLGMAMKPLLKTHEFEKYDGDIAFTGMLEKYRTGKRLFEQDGRTDVTAGLVECLSLMPFDEYDTEDSVAFMVRAYDSNGKFLTSSRPGETYVVCQKNGIKYPVLKPEDLKSPIKNAEKTTLHIKLLPAH